MQRKKENLFFGIFSIYVNTFIGIDLFFEAIENVPTSECSKQRHVINYFLAEKCKQ